MTRLLVLLGALVLSGCTLLRPYRIDIQQGEKINNEAVASIKPHATTKQVEETLGSPNLVDPFHPDDWYYIYTFQRASLPRAENRVVLQFQKDQLVRISGNAVPPSRLEYIRYSDGTTTHVPEIETPARPAKESTKSVPADTPQGAVQAVAKQVKKPKPVVQPVKPENAVPAPK